ncbi:MAG: hypothetical protein IH851_08090 [Armatimonadetes bacterium]|nr:hypothetical protein [Armatimonadota bacterium]
MERSDGPELRWSVHMARREPRKAGYVVLAAVVAGIFGVVLIESVWMFPMGVAVILVSTADFLLPVRFEVSARGARRRCGLSVSAIGWESVRRVAVGEDGVKLSPLERRTRLAPFRGVFLQADGNRQEILDAISYWRNQHAADVGKAAHGGAEKRDDREAGGSNQEAPP